FLAAPSRAARTGSGSASAARASSSRDTRRSATRSSVAPSSSRAKRINAASPSLATVCRIAETRLDSSGSEVEAARIIARSSVKGGCARLIRMPTSLLPCATQDLLPLANQSLMLFQPQLMARPVHDQPRRRSEDRVEDDQPVLLQRTTGLHEVDDPVREPQQRG